MIGLGKGNSLEKWQFLVSMLDFWGVPKSKALLTSANIYACSGGKTYDTNPSNARRSPNNARCNLGGGFKDFLFSTLLGEMIQFD